ncbi:hypothetical protein NDU88_004142 [Pleurodeles waltl]|uniref:Uncharacterized protein n=1 Tax=Pleurodeles waltl TaxID=8319 RepID=A0AAV7UF97_PLEWA|nr:hypothetical protein NDU88_004142 [Pleurodeles waltl]
MVGNNPTWLEFHGGFLSTAGSGRALIEEQEADGTIKEGQTSLRRGGAEDPNAEPGEDSAWEDRSGEQENAQSSAEDKEKKDP